MTKSRRLFAHILKALFAFIVVGVIAMAALVWEIGAWNLVFPSHQHDSVAPAIPSELASPAILVFSKTNSFRHKDGIAGGGKVLASIAAQKGWGMFHTENGAVFNARDLEKFKVVVFLNASGDMLSGEQEAAFQAWMEAGGGWIGIHAAGDSSHLAWTWYRDNLIGANFTAHTMGPQFQRALVQLENKQHPVLPNLPDSWQHEEEWYSWEQSPRAKGFTVLATLDETTYNPEANFMGIHKDLRMGDHPVVWTNCMGQGGRSVYAAMGHVADAFELPQNKQLLINALTWLIETPAEPC